MKIRHSNQSETIDSTKDKIISCAYKLIQRKPNQTLLEQAILMQAFFTLINNILDQGEKIWFVSLSIHTSSINIINILKYLGFTFQ